MLKYKHLTKTSALALAGFLLTACNNEDEKVGEQIVNSVCVACHSQAINGAPIIGNKTMWSKRLSKGEDTLIQSAINGFELMPAKGGRTDLSDEDIAAAVRYMIKQVN